MENHIETIEYKGHSIEIYQDIDPINPIDEYEWLGKMYCSHSRYILGHSQFSDGMDALYQAIQDINPNYQKVHLHYENKSSNDFCNMYWDYLQEYAIALRIYMYDHSGITINTSGFNCPWDSGQIGFIFVSKTAIRKEYGWNIISAKRKEKILNILRSEVKTYDQYLTGDTYGYIIDDPFTNEHINSCWGFFGSNWKENGLLEYAENAIDCNIESINKEKAEALIIETGDMDQVMLG